MKWIGLTGGIGTGKSTVAKILIKHQIPVIDADEVARKVIEKGTPGYQEVVQHFGPAILNSQGMIKRDLLAQMVFTDKNKLHQLESIIHPKVQDWVRQKRSELMQKGDKLAFYDVPLLFEKQLQSQFDKVVLVGSSQPLQLQRIKERSGLSQEEILLRISHQLPLYEKRIKADYVLENIGSMEELEAQVIKLIKELS